MSDNIISKKQLFFQMISFDLINFFFNCCLRFKFSASSLLPTLCLINLFSISVSKDVCSSERWILCLMSFYENLFAVTLSTLFYSGRRSVSGLRLTSSLPIFFNSTSCFYINLFNCSCCLSDHEIMSSNIWSDQ